MDKDAVKVFVDKVYADMAGAMTVAMAYVGVKQGLFRAMSGQGPMSQAQVVAKTGLEARYVEEWLKGMTAAGYLDYDPKATTFAFPEERAWLLASEGTDHYAGGMFLMAPALYRVVPKVAEAFAAGGGVPFSEIGDEGILALDLMNRGIYEGRLASYWLASLPETVRALENGGRVLDVGCGAGRVLLTIAQAFPRCRLVGIDPDPASLQQAEAAAEAAGVAERIRFVAGTTADLPREEGFDLITACDVIHDFAKPQETLRRIGALLKPEGTLFALEPKCADRLEDNTNDMCTVHYGFSIFHCMTQSLAAGGAGLGTCLGPERTMALLRQSGFSRVRPLAIKSQTSLFYAAQI
jgi:hypothetical protein